MEVPVEQISKRGRLSCAGGMAKAPEKQGRSVGRNNPRIVQRRQPVGQG
jgi:hypothetical protein|tara:strand:- start:2874 stop:3020 length:147 start_codon:yes stop_codon:yes gene_type:complete